MFFRPRSDGGQAKKIMGGEIKRDVSGGSGIVWVSFCAGDNEATKFFFSVIVF